MASTISDLVDEYDKPKMSFGEKVIKYAPYAFAIITISAIITVIVVYIQENKN